MANFVKYKDKIIPVGSTISITYKFKEAEKTRTQIFKGILIKVKGSSPQTRMITVRKMSKYGVGVERIIPLISPFVEKISVIKKSKPGNAKLYFIRGLSAQK